MTHNSFVIVVSAVAIVSLLVLLWIVNDEHQRHRASLTPEEREKFDAECAARMQEW